MIAEQAQPIPVAKLRGLREVLDRDHFVTFKNGAQIEFEDCGTCGGSGVKPAVTKHSSVIVDERPCERCGGEKALLLVTRPEAPGGKRRFRYDDPGDVERAYKLALYGNPPYPQPSGDGAKYGDDPPF